MTRLVRVQMPRGAETIGHGHHVYPVENVNWTALVPLEIAQFMVEDGRSGLSIIDEPDPDHHQACACPHCGRVFLKEA